MKKKECAAASFPSRETYGLRGKWQLFRGGCSLRGNRDWGVPRVALVWGGERGPRFRAQRIGSSNCVCILLFHPHHVSNHTTCLWVDVVRFYSFWCAIANRGHRLHQKYMECLPHCLSFIFYPHPTRSFLEILRTGSLLAVVFRMNPCLSGGEGFGTPLVRYNAASRV